LGDDAFGSFGHLIAAIKSTTAIETFSPRLKPPFLGERFYRGLKAAVPGLQVRGFHHELGKMMKRQGYRVLRTT